MTDLGRQIDRCLKADEEAFAAERLYEREIEKLRRKLDTLPVDQRAEAHILIGNYDRMQEARQQIEQWVREASPDERKDIGAYLDRRIEEWREQR